MTISLRAHFQNLILGTSGSTYVMTAGRFGLRSPDCTLETHPVDSVERKVEVILDDDLPHDPRNLLDGQSMQRCELKVRIGYARTNAGGDATEAVSEHSGAGTLDAIRDRIKDDAHDLETVLMWHENRAGTSPALCKVVPTGRNLIVGTDRVILERMYEVATEVLNASAAP